MPVPETRLPVRVRVGLAFIKALVRLKAITLALGNLLFLLLRPLGRLLTSFLLLPIYRVAYALRRRVDRFYRPAKNKLMFFVTNRYTVHTIVIAIAVVAGVVNFRLSEARAESYDFGQRSILYSLVTKQQVEVIEEYANLADATTYHTVSTFGDDALRAPLGDTSAIALVTPETGVLSAGDLALMSPAAAGGSTSASLVPRTEVISYTVEEGDTLSTISQRFGISLDTLLWANNLGPRSIIKPGAALTILPVSGVSHQVKSGETLSAIAKKYGVETTAVLAYNDLNEGEALKVGQPLIVPGGELQAPVVRNVASASTAVKTIFTSAPAGSGSTAKPAAGAGMVWPTDLRYVVRGLAWGHTGVDIDCSGRANGTSTNDNYAAADGIVQFSGPKGGYGNTVEINHGNGIVTRYGHFYSIYVKKGESVTAGTALGRCGSTGTSTGTHLHFEVIANGKFKNPFDYLGY